MGSDGDEFRSIEVRKILDRFKAAMAVAADNDAKYRIVAAIAEELEHTGDDGSYPIDDVTECAVDRHGLNPDRVQDCMLFGSERAREAIWTKPNGHGNGAYQDQQGRLRESALRQQPETIRLRFFDELTNPQPKPWLIKNVIAAGETSSWIGAPGVGKSSLVTDFGIHLAARMEWRGHRVREARGCIYFALEKVRLVERRLSAYRFREARDDLPIAVAGQIIDLMDKSCVASIVAAIKRVEDRYGVQVALAIFDTWSKGIAAGGGDENHARDQNIAAANLRRVIDELEYLHIATIGHTGKDESKGERGSNAKLADVDLQVQLSGDDIKTATVTKANDQQMGELTSFRLEPFEFGSDEDGDPFSTFIVSREQVTGTGAANQHLSDRQKLALEALANCDGHPAPPSLGLPCNLRCVALDDWRDELVLRGILDKEAANPRQNFRRLRQQLAAKRLIGESGDFVWLSTAVALHGAL